MDEIKVERIARVCHEANKGICDAAGQIAIPWSEAPEWQKDSAISGVKYTLDHPDGTPRDQHGAWMKAKVDDGWVYGSVKDPGKKLHPCIVPYDELPFQEKVKDHVFRAIVHAMKDVT